MKGGRDFKTLHSVKRSELKNYIGLEYGGGGRGGLGKFCEIRDGYLLYLRDFKVPFRRSSSSFSWISLAICSYFHPAI